MEAHREARGDARELERRSEERATLALAVEVEVAAFAGLRRVLEPDRRIGLAVVDELGRQHLARSLVPGDRLAVGGERFIDDVEAVAAAQLAVEIDVGREDLGDLARDRVWNVRFVGRGEQRIADHAAAHAHLRRERRGFDAGFEARAVAADAQPREVGRGQLGRLGGVAGDQLVELSVGVGANLDHLAGAACQQPAGDRVVADERGGRHVVDVQAAQQRVGGVAQARQVVAIELELVGSQRLELGVDVQRSDRFGHDVPRKVRCVGGHRRDAESGGAKARQRQHHRVREAAGVAGDELSGALQGGRRSAIEGIQRTQFLSERATLVWHPRWATQVGLFLMTRGVY